MTIPSYDLAQVFRHTLRENNIVQDEGVLVEFFNIDVSDEILSEAGASKRGDEYIIIRGREISFEDFKRAYTNYDTHDTYERVLGALGVDLSLYGGDKKRQTRMRKDLLQAVAHFRSKGFQPALSDPKDREAVYSKRRQTAVDQGYVKPQPGIDQIDDEQSSGGVDGSRPTMDSINSGRGQRPSGKSTQIIQKVNDNAAIFVGDFYNNQSRIPPSRWASWLKFWDREKTRVPKDKALFGRNWKKSFVLGYQLEANSLYEIWYNTIDSSFSVHDVRGIEVTRRAATMTEIMNNFVRFLRQVSPEDRELFTSTNAALAKSMARSMIAGLEGDQRMQDMIRINKESMARERKAQMDKSKSAREQKANWAKNMNNVKDNLKDAADRFGGVGARAFDRASKNNRSYQGRSDSHDSEWMDGDKSSSTKGSQKSYTGSVEGGDVDVYRPNKNSILDKLKRGLQDPDDVTDAEYDDDVKEDAEAVKKRREDILKRLRQSREQAERENRDDSVYGENANVFGEEMINESMIIENDEFLDRMADAVKRETDAAEYERRVKAIRAQVTIQSNKPQQLTVSRLKREVTDELIQPYTSTRVEKSWLDSGFFRSMFSGRGTKIKLPTDKPGFVSRTLMSVSGTRHQADFVVGFTISDRVNIEIWYVTEPNPDYNWRLSDIVSADRSGERTISTYYVYDVTSKKLISAYQPYLRSAYQVAMSKLGSY